MAKSKPKSKASASAKMSATTKKKISASQKKRLATLKRKKEEAERAKMAAGVEDHRLDTAAQLGLGVAQEPIGEIHLSFRPRRFLDAHLEHLTDLGNQVNEIEAQLEAFLKRAGVSHGGNDGKFTSIIESQNAMDQVAAVTNLLQRQINRLGENVFRLSQII